MSDVLQHDYRRDTPIQLNLASENRGFLLTNSYSGQTRYYWAHYDDGLVERINPPSGYPRPDPDPANRTKKVKLLDRHQEPLVPNSYKHASKHTGQMRRMVQCLYSRGQESPFAYTFQKTHGILEFPSSRVVGNTAGEEEAIALGRRFFLVEVSPSGMYAAPIEVGVRATRAAFGVEDYMPTNAQLSGNPGLQAYVDEISLDWAFVNRNEGKKIIKVLDSDQIAPAYANGGTWYGEMGWAFSISGTQISNVVAKDVIVPWEGYYETRLIDFAVTCTVSTRSAEIINKGLDVNNIRYAEVFLPGHGFSVGDLAIISGAVEDAYTGAHVVKEVYGSGSRFTYILSSDPPTPATGDIKVGNSKSEVKIEAGITVGSAGKVTFKAGYGGTLWVPKEDETGTQLFIWKAIRPLYRGASAQLACNGAVHVFYDGEDKKVTTWQASYNSVPAAYSISPTPNWNNLYGDNWSDYYTEEQLTSWYWAGNTLYSCHFWTEETKWVSPKWQNGYDPCPACWYTYMYYYGPYPAPGTPSEHECEKTYGGQPSYPVTGTYDTAHTDSNFGFDGSGVGQIVLNNSYSHNMATTAKVGGPYVMENYGYCNWDKWYICPLYPEGGPHGENQSWGMWRAYNCSAPMGQNTSYTFRYGTEGYGGGCALMLFASDREAVASIDFASYTFEGNQWTKTGGFGCGTKVWAIDKTAAAGFEDYQYDDGIGVCENAAGGGAQPISTSEPWSYTFRLNASGAVQLSVTGDANALGSSLTDFTWWQAQLHEEVTSSLFFMRGGMYYAEPNLSDPYQIDNYVAWYAGAWHVNGGFASVDGKSVEVFYGRV